MVEIKIINKSGYPNPEYATEGSAGFDLRACLTSPIEIEPHCSALIGTGLYMQIPKGYEGQIRPRSGLALTKCVTVLNSPGTIDSDYTGEIGVILINHSNKPFIVLNGMRIAQIVITKCEQAKFVTVVELDDTERGEGGFGHTGV